MQKKTILIVNGEKYWPDFLPEYHVIQKKIQHSSWVLKNDALYVIDREGHVKPDGILWRIGAIKPSAIQRTALNLIELSGLPCINKAKTLQHGYDRLSMLNILRELGFPVIPFNVASQARQLKNVKMDFPFVVKAGNYHGGFGKVFVEREKNWQDIQDLLFVTTDYITIEPYINYAKDIRYIAIGDKVWAMERKGKFWKANVETTEFKLMEPQSEMTAQIKQLQKRIDADLVAIDILEEENGKQYVVEYNDIPGLSGFPDELKYELANIVKLRIRN